MSGLRVTVVLSDVNAGEVTLGPFNQGVVVESSSVGSSSTTSVVDVASKAVVAQRFGDFWTHGEEWYARAFIQGVPEEEV